MLPARDPPGSTTSFGQDFIEAGISQGTIHHEAILSIYYIGLPK
jgi:hypothetical protein